jgi:hypothetical protein
MDYSMVGIFFCRTVRKNMPDSEQSMRKGLSDIGGVSLLESFFEGI